MEHISPITIKMFLCKGNPEGLRTAEISNWTGKAVAASRAELKALVSREEVDRPGVYILVGFEPENNAPAMYIGEAESIAGRVTQHSNKEFWNSLVVFFSKDDNLTKAHGKYIEGKLIEKAEEVGIASIKNSMPSGARLPESDAAEMDIFLNNIYQLLPVLGIDYFRTTQEKTAIETELFYCKIKGLIAKGKRTPNGFMVMKGSQAVPKHRPSASHYVRVQREELINDGTLIEQDDYLEFTKDIEFGSPSMAAGVVRGGNTNGPNQWKNIEGKTLKDLDLLDN